MVSSLDIMVEKLVTVVTTDDRQYIGTLKGFDQASNIILDDCKLCNWSSSLPMEQIGCSTQLIRGDTVVIIGLVEGELPIIAPPLTSSL